MNQLIEFLLISAYAVPAAVLMLFGLNLYLMLFLFARRRRRASRQRDQITVDYFENHSLDDLPVVATQIPLYNENNVAERIIRAVAAMDYPTERHIIQVLDDSTDGTKALVDAVVDELKNDDLQIEVVRRTDRIGYKAGALQYGMERTDAEYFAIFDADFVPPRDFLMRTVPVMLVKEEVGLVQGRWGHLNSRRSLLTRAQGIGIDGHFTIEQPARAWNRLFMNFNGTAGLWRRQAIEDAGGWEHDTLTEDMDLSYRSQLSGWKPYFMWDLEVPAEIPESINAFKTQQFRWAKGSIQTAIKLLPRVFRSRVSLFAKVQAIFHMTHYIIHPVMVWLSVSALPVLAFTRLKNYPVTFSTLFVLIVLTTLAPSLLYAVSQCCLYKHGWTKLRFLPFLTALGIGIAVSNSRAVIEAILGVDSEFVRTPKKGDQAVTQYKTRIRFLPLLELLIGVYCFISLSYYLHYGEYLIGPFLLLYACGFTSVGLLSLANSIEEFREARA